MKRILAALWVLVLSIVACAAQTNGTNGARLGFSLPSLRLRAELQAETEKTTPILSLAPTVIVPTRTIELESSLGNTEFRSSVIRSGEFYLIRAEQPSDSGVVRFVDSIFTPEVVHIGKVPVACSIVTAIKRKNPLCLLNPYVVQISW